MDPPIIPPPQVKDKATPAFRVKHIREQCSNFVSQLEDVFSAIERSQKRQASTYVTFGERPSSRTLSVKDLRIDTETEALQKVRTNVDIDASLQIGPSSMNGEMNRRGRRHSSKDTELAQYMGRKERAEEVFKAAVQSLQEERTRERKIAQKILRSLTPTPKTTGTRSRLKQRLAPTAVVSQEDEVQLAEPASDGRTYPTEGSTLEDQTLSTLLSDRFRYDAASLASSLKRIRDPGRETQSGMSKDSNLTDRHRVPEGEVVVHMTVYLPQAPSTPGEEWLVLGSEPLTEVKDALYCLNEQNAKAVEMQENAVRNQHPERLNLPKLELVKPSAYFYFEGTFYIDRRDANAQDLSQPLRSYLAAQGIAAPPHPAPSHHGQQRAMTTSFSVASMEHTRIEDLYLRIGSSVPGLYCHLGGCEHLVVVDDVRLYDAQVDPPMLSQYPYRIRVPSGTLLTRRQCEACGYRAARKVTYDDRNAPYTPFFWCDECFRMMHYDADGHVLYTDFKVFPYTHDYQSNLLHGHVYYRKRHSSLGTAQDGNEASPAT